MDTPPVIAVIGPVEPELLTAWVDHYRRLGVERFLLAFHFPDHVPGHRRDELKEACEALRIAPLAVSTGPWHEHTNTELRDMLRDRAGTGWHLLADADEFHAYQAPLAEVVAEAEASGTSTVGGLMLDRVSADGRLTGWFPSSREGLDAAYPLGGFLTHLLLRGDPRKIVLAHSGVPVDSGNHRAEGHRPVNRPPVVVHHFKWRRGVREDLERRAARTADGSWKTKSPALLLEARRLLSHLSLHDGRIDVTPFRPVSLQETPLWWPEEATQLAATWRPSRRSPAR
ncbi:glycosyltransferase family 2 protein [Streptomyces acidiscabies]|uniref:glycosyltransferase family 2 protein n=1 Tax=Streptomyces acidiscabies TaxID=42234 RepID=UPI0030D31A42